ncbi:MAG: acetolactate synthase small subunit [Oscillospiraceae bacterium]|nr:acetolactate synthase small subunit [Oscillospiraceae bacterium]
MNKAVFSVLTVDHPGVLPRVTGLFARRGFNIDSIIAGRTDIEGQSRWTFVVSGDDAVFAQMTRQLHKSEDVLKVEVLADPQVSELLLCKVRTDVRYGTDVRCRTGADCDTCRAAVLSAAGHFGSRVLDIGEHTMTFEMTGPPDTVDAFVAAMREFGIVVLARTGISALARGDGGFHETD